jgi:hypothetical protein
MKNFKKSAKSDMKKLTMDELKAAAKNVSNEEALAKVSGGTQAVCHAPGCANYMPPAD